MTPRFSKFLCFLLIAAALMGSFSGCHNLPNIVPTTPGTTTGTDSAAGQDASAQPRPTKPLPVLLTPGPVPSLPQPTKPVPALPGVSIPKVSADTAFVYDLRTNTFLYSSCDVTTPLSPASTTKLFTTYVALQYLQLKQQVTVGSELSFVKWDAADVGFRKGDMVSVEALTYAALLPSGCDASYILAAAAGREILKDHGAPAKQAVQAFMAECNRLARKLGMVNTHFVTADGYHHAEHYISVQAFAIIAGLCLENKALARIAATASVTITYTNIQGKTCTKTLHNTNRIIQPDSSKYYHPSAVGLKTGYTKAAGYCLLTVYRVEDGYILVGLFGCKDAEDRFLDANRLFEAFAPHI